MPKYSVVVLIFHRTQELVDMAKDCIASIKNNSEDYELIIIDNGSENGSPMYWQSQADVYVRLSKNRGIAPAWNIGLKLARGKFIAVCNDDILVGKGWLEKMSAAHDLPQAGATALQVQNLPQDTGVVDTKRWLPGSCFMLKQKTIEKVGYFDERFFPAQFEDVDYWHRMFQVGLKYYVDHSFTIQHKESQTLKAPDIGGHYEANKKLFIEKWGFDPIPVYY